MHLGKVLCLGLGMLLANSAIAQGPQHVFRVSFKDKQGSPSLSDPLVFLSQRSLDRRAAQGIALDSTDQPVAQAYLNDVLVSTGGILNTTSRWLNHCTILLDDSSKILQLQGKSYITGIDYIAFYSTGLHLKTQVKDKFESERTGPASKTTGSPGFYGTAAYGQTVFVNGDYLHDRGYKGQGKLIAVMDQGFRAVDTNPAFDSLRQSGRLIDVHNFARNNSDVYTNTDPYGSNHGTNALSTMAAYVPGVYVGSAPLAQYALYCTEIQRPGAVETEVELENMVSASERADSIGADVISESLGYNGYDNPFVRTYSLSEIDGNTTVAAKAANMATTKGILFVASAGNEGGGAWNYVLSPGDADSALTVGSVDANRMAASNSGYGLPTAARIKPDVCVLGAPCQVLSGNTNAFSSYGTSFATSQLAGWAACLLQSTKPSPYRIRRAIIESADRYSKPDYHVGHGVPDFAKAFELLDVKTPGIPDGESWSKVLSNPFRDHIALKIMLMSYSEIKVSLVDISGRVLFQTEEMAHHGIVDMPIPADKLPAGMYFLKVMTGNKQMTHKLVKF